MSYRLDRLPDADAERYESVGAYSYHGLALAALRREQAKDNAAYRISRNYGRIGTTYLPQEGKK